ncbi:uncharacterized protein LOC110266643 [Arachis ipaensis]|uniref:Uncharacterized protein n=1 Tax=Arachis hypogaea TaxID=3818 RepID=A0A6B9V849_ARAHY|nr:uncharacterized protein LOC110266643 [Arachis ipaensis]QHN77407.1 uncharacterized protein DS421_19g652450 [Arachis hypogaea]
MEEQRGGNRDQREKRGGGSCRAYPLVAAVRGASVDAAIKLVGERKRVHVGQRNMLHRRSSLLSHHHALLTSSEPPSSRRELPSSRRHLHKPSLLPGSCHHRVSPALKEPSSNEAGREKKLQKREKEVAETFFHRCSRYCCRRRSSPSLEVSRRRVLAALSHQCRCCYSKIPLLFLRDFYLIPLEVTVGSVLASEGHRSCCNSSLLFLC